jgi:hypothetical protein
VKNTCARRKSQTSTEYLIILAVVIVIALVVVNTMGGFPGIGAGTNKKVSDLKLATDTIGIESYSIGTSSSLFKLKNNYYDTVTVTEFRVNQQNNLTCNSSNTNPALPIVLNVGQSKIINCTVVNSSSYIISDRQTPLLGVSYTDNIGAVRTAGNVPSYGNSSNGGVVVIPPISPLGVGLVSQWKMNDNATNTVIIDSIGHHNGTTFLGTNTTNFATTGLMNGSFLMDSSVGNGLKFPTINMTNAFTIMMWVKMSGFSTSESVLWEQGNTYISGSPMWYRGNFGGLCFHMPTADSYFIGNQDVARDGNWHLLSVRYDPNDVNGTLIMGYDTRIEYAVDTPWGGGNIITAKILNDSSTWGYVHVQADISGWAQWPGKLDQILLYNRALTTNEINSYYINYTENLQ